MESPTMPSHQMFVLHSPYPDGTWRGMEKCSGAHGGATLMFSDREDAEKYKDAMSDGVGMYFRVVPVTVNTPSVRGPLEPLDDPEYEKDYSTEAPAVKWTSAIIGIDYDEATEEDDSAPLNYRGVTLKMMPDGDVERFMSGDVTVDYVTAGSVAHYRLGPDGHVICSSSVDHFAMDSGYLEEDPPEGEKVTLAITLARQYLINRGEYLPKDKTA